MGIVERWIWVPFMIIGPSLIVWSIVVWWQSRRRSAEAKHWVQGQATIIEASVDQSLHSGMSDGSSTSGASISIRPTYSYRPCVRYRYHAAGLERAGTRAFLNPMLDWNDQAIGEVWLACYPGGATVPVWYDPEHPDRSALAINNSANGVSWLMATIGIGFTLGALFWWSTYDFFRAVCDRRDSQTV